MWPAHFFAQAGSHIRAERFAPWLLWIRSAILSFRMFRRPGGGRKRPSTRCGGSSCSQRHAAAGHRQVGLGIQENDRGQDRCLHDQTIWRPNPILRPDEFSKEWRAEYELHKELGRFIRNRRAERKGKIMERQMRRWGIVLFIMLCSHSSMSQINQARTFLPNPSLW